MRFDVFCTQGLSCADPMLRTFFAKLAFSTAAPIVIGVVIFGPSLARIRFLHHDKKHYNRQACNAFLVMVYLVFPSVSTVIFLTFQCDSHFGVDSETFLIADYTVACSGPPYFVMRNYALITIACYPIGVCHSTRTQFSLVCLTIVRCIIR